MVKALLTLLTLLMIIGLSFFTEVGNQAMAVPRSGPCPAEVLWSCQKLSLDDPHFDSSQRVCSELAHQGCW